MRFYKNCIMCGRESFIDLTDEEYEGLLKRERREVLIQDACPDMTKTEREFLISGVCNKCQKSLFNGVPSERIHLTEEVHA